MSRVIADDSERKRRNMATAIRTRRASRADLGASLSGYEHAGLSRQDLIQIYRWCALGRALDQRAFQLHRQGRAPFILSCAGQETAQAAVTWPLHPDRDILAPYYRDVVACFRMGMTAYDIMLSVLAKAEDPASGARQTPGHFSSKQHHILSRGSPVASQLVWAAGAAYAAKLKGDQTVAMAMFGEGASAAGDTHEAMNFAGIHHLPIVFVCENNGYAISTPQRKEMAIDRVALRAEAYGFGGVTVDGADIVACYAAARDAVERARHGDGPTLVECLVDRLGAHSTEDEQRRYRSQEEIDALADADGIAHLRANLVERRILSEEEVQQVDGEVRREIDDATQRASRAADPQPEAALEHVYGVRNESLKPWPNSI